MKVKAIETRNIEVELRSSEVDRIFLTKLYDLLNWKDEWYIKDGNVMREDEYYTSHKWYDETIIREASKEDIKNYEMIKTLCKKLYK